MLKIVFTAKNKGVFSSGKLNQDCDLHVKSEQRQASVNLRPQSEINSRRTHKADLHWSHQGMDIDGYLIVWDSLLFVLVKTIYFCPWFTLISVIQNGCFSSSEMTYFLCKTGLGYSFLWWSLQENSVIMEGLLLWGWSAKFILKISVPFLLVASFPQASFHANLFTR